MSLSRSRLIIRVFLVVMLLGVVGLGFLVWKRSRPENMWQRSQAAIEAGDMDTAKITLKSLLQKDPEHVNALLAMADIHRDETAKKIGRGGDSHHISAQAMECLLKAVEAEPENPAVLKPLLKARIESRRLSDAGKIAAALLKTEADNVDALYTLVIVESAAKNFSSANTHLKSLMALKGEPTIRTMAASAALAKASKDTEKHRETLAMAMKKTADPQTRFKPAEVEYYAKLHHEALTAAKTPAEADQHLAAALRFERLRSTQAGQIIPAGFAALQLALIAQQRQGYPPNADKKLRDARKALVTQAVKLGEAAAKQADSQPEVERLLVYAVAGLGDFKATIEHAESGLTRLAKRKAKSRKVELELHGIAAETLFQQRKYVSARKHIGELLKDSRFSGRGHLNAGTIDLAEGRLESARAHLEDARRLLGTDHLLVRDRLGRVLAQMGLWREALPYLASVAADYERLTSIQRAAKPDFESQLGGLRLLLVRGRLAVDQPRAAESVIAQLKGTRFEAAGRVQYILYLNQNKRTTEAAEMLSEARAKFPDDRALVLIDAVMRLRAGKSDEADALIRKFAAARSNDIESQGLLYRWLTARREYDKALAFLDELQKQFPTHWFPTFARAQTQVAKKQFEKAAKTVAELRKLPNMQAIADGIAAEIAMRQMHLNEAADLLDSSGFKERNTGYIGLLKGKLNVLQGDPTAAIDSISDSLEVTRRRASASRTMAVAMRQLAFQKSPAAALKKLNSLIAQYPNEPSLMLAKAELQARLGQFVLAMKTLQDLENLQPKSAIAVIQQARFWNAIGRPADGLKEAKRALARDPENSAARLLAINAANRLGLFDETLKHLEIAIQQNPDVAAFYVVKSSALRQLKRADEAVLVLDAATKKLPKSASLWLALSRAYAAEKKSKESQQALADGRKQNPENLKLIRESLDRLLAVGRDAEAEALAKKLAGAKPGFAVAHHIGETYLRHQEYAAARRWAEVATSAADKSGTESQAAAMLSAQIDFQQGLARKEDAKRLEQARDTYEALLKKNPKLYVAANNLAWLYANRFKNPSQGRKILEGLVESAPLARLPANNIDTLLSIYRQQNDLKQAIALVDAAVLARPTEPAWLRFKVELALQSRQADTIVTDLQRLQRDRRWSPEPAFALARVYSALRNSRSAISEINRALEADPKHLPALLLAVAEYERQGDHAAVVRHAAGALAINPNLWRLYEQQAKALRKLNRAADADKSLSDAIARVETLSKAKPEPAAFVVLTRLQTAKGANESALASLDAGLKKFPQNAALVAQGVEYYLQRKQAPAAVAFASKHLADTANYFELRAIVKLFYDAKESAAASHWADRMVKASGKRYEKPARLLAANVALATARDKNGKAAYQTAIGHFEAVLQADPTNVLAGNNLAWLLVHELNEPAKALKVVERALGNTPVNRMHVGFIDTLALVYRKNDRIAEARKLLEEATALHPGKAGLQFQMGLVYIKLNKPIDARKALQKALQLGLEAEDAKVAEEQLKAIRKQVAKQP